MSADLDLNTSANLPDGTAASQAGGYGAKAADFKRGYLSVEQAPCAIYEEDTNKPEPYAAEKSVDELAGFLNRPHGWQR